MLQVIPPSSFRRQAWANGGGTTTELAAGPDPERWLWRICVTHTNADGDLQRLPGVRRQLAPLDGNLQLRFADGGTLEARRLQALCFDGDRHATRHWPDEPGRELDLTMRHGVDGDLVVRPLLGSMVLLPRADTRWFAYLLGGQADVGAGDERLPLEAGHAAWIRPRAGTRVLIDGGGEIVLVRLTLPEASRDTLDPPTP